MWRVRTSRLTSTQRHIYGGQSRSRLLDGGASGGFAELSLAYTGVIGVLSAAALWLTAPSVNEGQTIAELTPTDGRVLAGWTVLASSLLVPVAVLVIAFPEFLNAG